MTTEPKVADLLVHLAATGTVVSGDRIYFPERKTRELMKDALDAIARQDAASPWQLPFSTVQRVVLALTQLGVAVPESSEEQSAKVISLVELLCDEAAPGKLRVQPEQQGAVDVLGIVGRYVGKTSSAYRYIAAELAARQPAGQEPVAQVAEDFIFLLRKQPNGERWPVGTKLYAAPPAQVDLEQFRAAVEAYRADIDEDFDPYPENRDVEVAYAKYLLSLIDQQAGKGPRDGAL